MFIDFREGREGERERETETLMWERTYLGSNLQPRYVPWPEIEPATFLVYGTMFQPTEPLGQGKHTLLKMHKGSSAFQEILYSMVTLLFFLL